MHNTLVRSRSTTTDAHSDKALDTNATTNRLSTRISIHVAVASVLLAAASLAQAASDSVSQHASDAEPLRLAQATTSFDLPSQPLADSLRSVAAATDSNILFDRSLVRGLTAKPLRAELSVKEAIAELLKGTQLTFRNADDRTFLIASTEQASAGADAASSAPERNDRLEEVIVTAQKQEEALLDVPVPVTVLSASVLADKSQFRIQDYYSSIPGMSVASSELAPTVAIRGIIASAGANPTVGVILDDMPLGAATAIGGGYFAPELDPADLARIEVLRGPQGTLYGASSVGGLLKYVTVDPSVKALSGRVQMGANTVAHGGAGYNVSGGVNVPMSDTVAVRVSGFSRHEAGYIDNVRSGGVKDVNEADLHGGRVAALWAPNDALSIKLAALYQNNEVSGFAYVTREDPPLRDLEQSFVANSGSSERNFKAYSANVNYNAGAFEVVSITGYSESRYTDVLDYSDTFGELTSELLGTPNALDHDYSMTYKFTQEVRFSTTFGDNLDWLVGVYFGNEKSPYRLELVGADDNGATIDQLLLLQYESALKEKSIFTNFTYRFTDKFDIQIGGRRADIQQSFEEVDSGILLEPDSPVVTPKETFTEDASTFLLTPRYKISADSMAYVRIASGYRPGGVNAAGLTGLAESNAYEPDTTWNYEFGIKGTALGRTLSYDVSLYRIDWSDIQLTLIDPDTGTGFFANAGEGRSQGIELAVEVAPTDRLTLEGWITLTDATLTQDMPEGAAFGLRGDRLPYSAKFSAYVAAEYQFSVAAHRATVGADFSYVGDRVADFLTAEESREKFASYTELNLTAGLAVDQWTLGLYLNNATDERGVTGGGAGSTIPRALQVIQPRTLGLSLARSFE